MNCRYEHVIYSNVKPPMRMIFWNIQSFEQLERNLIYWLDWEINDNKRIRSIERLISYISITEDNNGVQRIWVRVKDHSDVRAMMSGGDDIIFIIVISLKYCGVKCFYLLFVLYFVMIIFRVKCYLSCYLL